MFCHDRVSSGDFYLPRRHFPRIKQDPVDIIISGSVLNFVPPSSLDNSLPLSREVPSSRKEDATIVYLQRSNRPLVSLLQQLRFNLSRKNVLYQLLWLFSMEFNSYTIMSVRIYPPLFT